jgi:uncharacterized membrane protein YfcA
LTYWLYVLASGAGGLLVGILGTGSSLILLPSLALIFGAALPGGASLRLAAGTTMATMAVGAIAGAVAQYRAGHVDLKLLRLTVLPYALGALAGPWISRGLPATILGVYVSAVICVVALRMLFPGPRQAKPEQSYAAHPGQIRATLTLISVGCSIVGIASGLFAIPYLSRFSVPMRTVIGTSTASAAVYSTFGAIGYVSAGWSAPGLPDGHFGFVYLPAFAVMAVTASIATPIGVRLARFVDERSLKRLFAAFLLIAAGVIAFTK